MAGRKKYIFRRDIKKKRSIIIGVGASLAVVLALCITLYFNGWFTQGQLNDEGAKPQTEASSTPAPTETLAPEITPTPSPDANDGIQNIPLNIGKPVNPANVRYELVASLNTQYRQIAANMRVHYTNTTPDTLYEIVFHLPANSYLNSSSEGSVEEGATYPRGFSNGGIIIQSATLDGVSAYYALSDDETFLSIPISRGLAPGENAELLLSFLLYVPQRNARYGVTNIGYQLGNCWPILAVYQDGGWVKPRYSSLGDPYYSDVADYAIAIAYPQKYNIASSGAIVKSDTESGITTSYIAAEKVRDFTIVLSEGTYTFSENYKGVELISTALTKSSAERGLVIARECLLAFNPYLGDYPYSTLTVSQTELNNATGVEFPGLIMIQRELYLPGNDQQLYFTIAHEIAHQWFYGIVGNDQANNPWLDESMCAYFSFIPLLDHIDNRAYNTMRQYFLVERADKGGRIDGALYDYVLNEDYSNSVYWRGAAMLGGLIEKIGESAFYEGVKLYVTNNAFAVATPDDFIYAFEQASETSLRDWFLSWFKEPAQDDAIEQQAAQP